ncbi:AfsR/SARP family transcriptional regulator [Kribbella sp. CA-294648]|uniref:AfsR/SARP family transcriptional regulator n=1 Tax=Kribbella sp. CA-294648 TaxID=3239948 RepID=UPI003D91F08E
MQMESALTVNVHRSVGPLPSAQRDGELFEARLFGPFQILRTGSGAVESKAMARSSVRTLLKWFLLNPGDRFEAGTLCEVLWPNASAPVLSKRLDVTVHHLRRLLEPDLPARQRSRFVRSDRDRLYWFDLGGCWWTDLQEAQALSVSARRAESVGDDEGAIALYESIVQCHEKTFLLENVFDEAFASARAAQEVAHQEALNRLLPVYVRVGALHKAIPCALALLELDPYSEVAATTLAEIHLRQGHQISARKQLFESLQRVQQELGCRPSEHALQVWRQVADPAQR